MQSKHSGNESMLLPVTIFKKIYIFKTSSFII